MRLDLMRWRPCGDETLVVPPHSHVLERLTRGDDQRGEVWRLAIGDHAYLLKQRRARRWSQRCAATLGRSPLHREAAMMLAARGAGLPVPRPMALGVTRRVGVVTRTALLIEWLAGHECLRGLVVAKRIAGADAAELYARLLGRVRRAGFADRDFGVGNVLVASGAPSAGEGVWIDLEAAFRAGPDDRAATVLTCGGALTSWWVATGGDAKSFSALFAAIRAHAPEPRGGWDALLPRLNARIAQRAAKQRRHGRIDAAPPALQPQNR